MNIDRLDRIAADEVNRIETLPKANEVLIVVLGAGPPPTGAVERIGGARHGAESDVASADREIARRIARVQLEFLRREADVGLDKIGIKANAARGGIDVGAGPFQHCAGLVVQEVDADLLEHAERRLMDRFELVAGDKVERRERRLWLAGRLCGAGSSAALGCAPATAPRILRRRIRGHCVPRIPVRQPARGGAKWRFVASIHSSRAARAVPRQMASGHANWRSPGSYFAARSFGASAAAASGSGGRASAPAENRAMSHDRNNATASLLRSSGWVVR